jgi:HTH-type transcriptional regulator, sugar sensing transcriptional regulator
MDIELVLQDIGFTKAEAKVYLTLQKSGETKAGKIIQQTGLQSSVVHNALNNLREKGFISHILVGNVKHYNPLKPGLIKEYIDNKGREFERIIPSIESLKKDSGNSPTAEVFTGIRGLIAATNKMIEDADSKEVFMYFAVDEKQSTTQTIEFFEKIDIIKKEKGIKIRGIASKKNVSLKTYSKSEIRFTNQDIPSAMNIYKDKILFYSFENKPTGILVESVEIANQYKRLWENLWSKKK